MLSKLKKRVVLISEGRCFSDKLKVLLSIITLNRYRPRVYLKNEDGVFIVRPKSSDLWMLSTVGESELRKYFNLEEGSFLDIGANVGKYSVIMGSKLKDMGEVFSFEPEPSNLNSLVRNIKLNRLNNVHVIPLACSRKRGRLEFYIDPNNSGGHSLVRKTNQKIIVETDKLDNIVENKKIKNIKLIKIDVEGAELDVLIGSKKTLKKYKPKIIFETCAPDKIIPFLEKLNYRVKKISKIDYIAE